MRRGLWFLATAALGGGAVSAAVASGACIVAPPADLPNVTHRPIVLHGSVVPPEDQVLTQWPSDSTFILPVQFLDPNPTYKWSAFVDDMLYGIGPPPALANQTLDLAPDGGAFLIDVTIDSTRFDLTRCHTITVLIGHDFLSDNGGGATLTYRLFDADEYDLVSWQYAPMGFPCTTTQLEAGPADDAAVDALAIAPESGPQP